jgi:hypothetical protein
MAPRPTYTKPHKQLLRLMAQARRRGLSFEEAWEEAMRPGRGVVMTNTPNPPAGAVRWPTDWNDRSEWMAALLGTEEPDENGVREAWERAYKREAPARGENALAFLADALDAWRDLADELADIEGVEDPDAGEDDTDFAELMAAA